MKKSKIIPALCILFALLFLFSFLYSGIRVLTQAEAADYYTSAKSMCTMEAGSKRVLYSKNMNEELPMASTTKIMTAITAIENCDDLDKPFEISPKAVGISGTSLYLRKGEVFTIRDLFTSLTFCP